MDDSYEPLFGFLRHLRSMSDDELETFAMDVWIAAGLGPQEPLPQEKDRGAGRTLDAATPWQEEPDVADPWSRPRKDGTEPEATV